MKFDGDEVLAENFDGLGLASDIQRNLGVPMAGRRVLLLGAGGAARGALLPFLEAGPAALFVANRTIPKALALRQRFAAHGPVGAGGYADIAGAWDVVVNATSASLRGELPPVPAQAFAPGRGLRGQEAFEGKAIAGQAGHAQRRDQRRRARHRADLHPGRTRGAHQPEAGIGDQRGTGIADQRQRLACLQARDDPLRDRLLVVFVQRHQRRGDPEMREQLAAAAGVLGADRRDIAQGLLRPRRQVAEVADGRGDDKKRSGVLHACLQRVRG